MGVPAMALKKERISHSLRGVFRQGGVTRSPSLWLLGTWVFSQTSFRMIEVVKDSHRDILSCVPRFLGVPACCDLWVGVRVLFRKHIHQSLVFSEPPFFSRANKIEEARTRPQVCCLIAHEMQTNLKIWDLYKYVLGYRKSARYYGLLDAWNSFSSFVCSPLWPPLFLPHLHSSFSLASWCVVSLGPSILLHFI